MYIIYNINLLCFYFNYVLNNKYLYEFVSINNHNNSAIIAADDETMK